MFFDPSPAHLPSFPEKLDILLTWSITSLQHGDHRPYAAVSLLRYWRNQEEERAIRRGRDGPDDFIQDQLFDWLDASDIAVNPANLNSVALVFGQLVKQGLFSYPRYIQRLIARGEQGLDSNKVCTMTSHSFRTKPVLRTTSLATEASFAGYHYTILLPHSLHNVRSLCMARGLAKHPRTPTNVRSGKKFASCCLNYSMVSTASASLGGRLLT